MRSIFRLWPTSDWVPRQDSRLIALSIGLTTFSILALELALIRWTSSQIRIMAYFNNIVLIATFLGMGLGVRLGAQKNTLVHFTLPSLLILSGLLCFAENLGLMHMAFPDSSISLWGGDATKVGFGYFKTLAVFFAIFCLHVMVFLFAGAGLGALFYRLSPLRAYTWDLTGSLVGILAFTGLNFMNAPPPVWLALGGVGFVFFSRSVSGLLCFLAIVTLGYVSIDGAIFSPYNRIDLKPQSQRDIVLNVNRDFHQIMFDLSDTRLGRQPEDAATKQASLYRRVYDLPFQVNKKRGRGLIVGAGTGNDVQAALRNHYQKVYSIDIDAQIMKLGSLYHPERPYADTRVLPVVNDARAFFQQYQGEPFDVIAYGLLDSHAMFSSMSSLRLDNYVYTEQGIRSAFHLLAEDGHLSISFSVFAGQWIFDRLYWTIARATGIRPMAVYPGMFYGATFIVARHMDQLDIHYLQSFRPLLPAATREQTMTTSDDWPFLYFKEDQFPLGYVTVLLLIVILATYSTRKVFAIKSFTQDFDLVLFCMGAAFLLIETRGITSLSLLFGSTWVVNSAVFASILALVLIANLLVDLRQLTNLKPWFILLFLSMGLLGFFDFSTLNDYALVTRGAIGGLLNALPIGFAGIIVSILLKTSENITTSLGSNLLGSVIGGCLEYLSLYLGLQGLVWLALCMYLFALLFLLRRQEMLAKA